MRTRREFTSRALRAMALLSLADLAALPGLASPRLGGHWLADLDRLGRDVKAQKLGQVDWQKQVEELFSKVELEDFLKLLDVDKLSRRLASFDGKGALSLSAVLPAVGDIPKSFVFGRQVFAMKKGRSIVPHGHNNMATAFLVLKGRLRGRLYDRLADEPAHLILAPTIDREFVAGGASTISDKKDNVHWFESLVDESFIFNIHVLGVSPGLGKRTGRVYVDPAGERIEGGRIRARLVDEAEVDRLYG
jgi:hypothetical protein